MQEEQASSVHEIMLGSLFSTMRCIMSALAEDMQLICKLSEARTAAAMLPGRIHNEISSMLREADGKMQSDTAAFMRAALKMYTMMEDDDAVFSYKSCSANSMHEMAAFVRSFVQNSVDVAITFPHLLLDEQRNIGIARDHCLLLANTLDAMVEEASSSSSSSSMSTAAAAAEAAGNKKRQRHH